MRHLFLILIITTCIACCSVSNPDVAVNELQTSSHITDTQVDSIFNTLRYFPNGTQFSIAFIDSGSAHFYGAIRREDTLRTIQNKKAVFEIGSLSKVFTSALLADLIVHNQLQSDHPVQDYLDVQLHNNLPITFEELANHTSGLPRIPSGFVWESLFHLDNPYRHYDEEKLRDYLANEIELINTPGTVYQYSNIGVGILGYTLTRVSGQSYEEMLQQKIFQPFEMHFSTTHREKVSKLIVPGLDKRGNPTSHWDFGALKGAGAILSNALDMSNFACANFDDNIGMLNLQREKTYNINPEMDIALGWLILKQDSTTRWHWHNGGTGGYRSSMVLHVEGKKGVVVLSNISSGHSHAAEIDSLSFFLLRIMNEHNLSASN